MARRRNRPKPPNGETIVARAGQATRSAQLDIVQDTAERTKIRGLPAGSQPPPPPWYAMIAFARPEYREVAFASNSGSGATVPRDYWGNYFERCLRYDVFWSHYEGNVYRKIHQWAEALKQDNGLYDYVRTIFSPAYRICEFWATHTLGGQLDPEAGDGKVKPSAIPIEVPAGNAKAEALRLAIARVWRDSNWQASKDTYPRFGSVLGDVALMVVDDQDRQKVYFRVINPRTIMDVSRDPWGNVKGYVISESRLDPRNSDPFIRLWVVYTEVAIRVGESVEYTTYLDGSPYDWRDYPDDVADEDRTGPVWTEQYGFIPLILLQNRDFGQGWGWSDLQPDISKLYELDDIASKTSDQVRKIVDALWYATGAAPGDLDVNYNDTDWETPLGPGVADDGPGRREKQPILYGPAGSTITPMVAPLDIAQVSAHIRSIAEEIASNHPELKTESVSADASGEARRQARQYVEAMVRHRRATYDIGLVRIQQMAISIGAMKGYPGFEEFTGDSYKAGELDHAIGDRPVFAVTLADRMADAQAQATIIQTFLGAGLPMRSSLRLAGYPEETVDQIMKDAAEEAAAAADTADAAAERQSERDAQAQRDAFDVGEPDDGDMAGPGTNATQGDVDSGSGIARE